MATSGSINYATSTREIITEALELLGVLGEGEEYNQDQYISARRTLNSLVKMWQADGLNLFAVQRGYLFPRLGQPYYDLTATSQDLFTTNYGMRWTDLPAVEGATELTLVDGTDASVGFYIGIQTTGVEMFWTTITNINGDVVTLSDPLPDDVVAGAFVYYYMNTANRPMRILEAYIHKRDGTEIPLTQFSRTDFMSLANKNTSGQITQYYYDPQINTGRLYVWPTANSEVDFLTLVMQRTLEDFANEVDEPDFPQEWFMPLAYNLAIAMAPKFGTPQMDYQRLTQQASYYYDMVKYWDVEQETSIFLKPNSWLMGL